MRNYFNIVRSIGLIFFGVGIFLLAVTLPEFLSRLDSSPYSTRNVWDQGLGAFFFLGVGTLIVGLAGLLKAKWFSLGGMVILVAQLILFSWLFLTKIWPSVHSRDFYLAIGLFITVYTVIISFMILLNNQYFLEALEKEDEEEEGNDQILDA